MKIRDADAPAVIIVDSDVSPELMEALKQEQPGQIISVPIGPEYHNTVLFDIQRERDRQDKKWGIQNHPDFYEQVDLTTGRPLGSIPLPARFTYYGIPTEEDAKHDCENAVRRGKLNWGHILVEEVSEAFGTTNVDDLETELIQVAATATAWVENIRRRRAAQ